MIKDSSTKKKLKSPREGPSGVQQKPSLKSKKMASEIDEIFASKKRKQSETEKKVTMENSSKGLVAYAKLSGRSKIEKKSRSKVPKEGVFADAPSQPNKKTADGLTIYTEEELGFGKPDAGGTRLCPFDCDCCF